MTLQQIDDQQDAHFHEHSHRIYRGAKIYVDASLRDSGHDPITTRICEPHAYAATIERVFRLHSVRERAILDSVAPIGDPERGQLG